MARGLLHEALPYAGVDGFAAACTDVVRLGLASDERLIVLADAAKLDAVTERLGSDADDVTFVPLDDHGRNPSRITTLLHSFQAGADGRHCIGVSESIVAGRSPAALAEAQLSEFLLNDETLADWPMTLVCLYDLDTLPDAVLESMRRSHATVRGEATNPLYLPGGGATIWATPLDPVPATARRMIVTGQLLVRMREFVRAEAIAAGFDTDRVDDLVLAANEIVTNSVRYSGGDADLAVWGFDGGVVCDVRDPGHLTNALIGRFTPDLDASSGRGMWLANQLCDLVQVRSGPGGTTVRLYLLP